MSNFAPQKSTLLLIIALEIFVSNAKHLASRAIPESSVPAAFKINHSNTITMEIAFHNARKELLHSFLTSALTVTPDALLAKIYPLNALRAPRTYTCT